VNIVEIRQCLCDCNLDDGHQVSPVVALCTVLQAVQDLNNYNDEQKEALRHAAQCVADHGFHGMRTQAEALLLDLGDDA